MRWVGGDSLPEQLKTMSKPNGLGSSFHLRSTQSRLHPGLAHPQLQAEGFQTFSFILGVNWLGSWELIEAKGREILGKRVNSLPQTKSASNYWNLLIFMVFVIVQIFFICMDFFKKLLRRNSIHKAYNLSFWKCAIQWFLIYSQFVQASSHVNFTMFSYPQKATPYPLIVTNHSPPQDTINLLAIW